MREFSNFEKRILNIMVDLQKSDQLSRQNIILKCYSELYYIDIEKNGRTNNLFIYTVDKSISEENFTQKTTQIYFLYKYLSSQCFIEDLGFTHRVKPIRNKKEIADRLLIHDYVEFFIRNNNLRDKLILSETIVKLVENHFISEGQIQFKKEQRVAWVAIFVAIIIGIISVIAH